MQIIFINGITKYLELFPYSVLFSITILYNYNLYYFTSYTFVVPRLHKMIRWIFDFDSSRSLHYADFHSFDDFKSNTRGNAIYTFQSDVISLCRI